MKEQYLNEFHEKYSKACVTAVKRMAQHPYTVEQKKEQAERLSINAKNKK